MHRRVLLASLLLAAACGEGLRPTWAQSSPSLLIIAPGPEGGGFDRFARAIGKAMEQAGVASTVTYENVGAAGGVTALPRLAEASASRPGVLMVTGSVMVGALIAARAEPLAGRVTPIARLAVEPLSIAVPPGGPGDVVALTDTLRRPDTFVISGGPTGSPDHLLVRSLAAALGLSEQRLVYQPHAGGRPAAESVLAGKAQAVLTNGSDLVPFVADQRLRIIAVTDVPPGMPMTAPTLRQSGIDVSGGNWRGLVAGPGIDAAERRRLTGLAAALARSTAWQQELAQRRWIDAFLADEALTAFLSEDDGKVRAAVAQASPARP